MEVEKLSGSVGVCCDVLVLRENNIKKIVHQDEESICKLGPQYFRTLERNSHCMQYRKAGDGGRQSAVNNKTAKIFITLPEKEVTNKQSITFLKII